MEGTAPRGPADVTLRIGTVLADIAKEHTISTHRLQRNRPRAADPPARGCPRHGRFLQRYGRAEFVHWHGQIVPASVDGAPEEKSLDVPAHGHVRYRLTPQPAGARFVHSHVMSMSDTNRGTYTGQFAFVYIEPKNNPGQYDHEVFLATHEWEPFFGAEEMEERRDESARKTKEPGEAGKAERLGDRISAVHHQRQVPRLWRPGSREGRAARAVSLPECQRHGEHPVGVTGPPVSGVALDGNPVPHPQAVRFWNWAPRNEFRPSWK